jgi:hypothetical protein
MQDCFEAILTSKSSCTASNAGSDGRIQYKLGCDHPSQLFWQCWNRQADCPTPEKIYLHGENTQEGTITMKKNYHQVFGYQV